MNPRDVDKLALGELVALIADAMTENGKPPPSQEGLDLGEAQRALAENWSHKVK